VEENIWKGNNVYCKSFPNLAAHRPGRLVTFVNSFLYGFVSLLVSGKWCLPSTPREEWCILPCMHPVLRRDTLFVSVNCDSVWCQLVKCAWRNWDYAKFLAFPLEWCVLEIGCLQYVVWHVVSLWDELVTLCALAVGGGGGAWYVQASGVGKDVCWLILMCEGWGGYGQGCGVGTQNLRLRLLHKISICINNGKPIRHSITTTWIIRLLFRLITYI
jgi:hypothetical protein